MPSEHDLPHLGRQGGRTSEMLTSKPTCGTIGAITTVLSMRLKASEEAYLEYRYTLYPDQYMLDYRVSSKGLAQVLENGQEPVVDWSMDAFHTEKGRTYENQYTYLSYAYGRNDKVKHLSAGGEDDKTLEDATWFAFKQQYFSTILLPEDGLHKATFTSLTLEDTLYTKRFYGQYALPALSGDFDLPMKLYFGPNRFHTLDKYGDNISDLIPLGWAIFGWINRWFVIPMFDLLFYSWHINHGDRHSDHDDRHPRSFCRSLPTRVTSLRPRCACSSPRWRPSTNSMPMPIRPKSSRPSWTCTPKRV